MYGPPTNGDFAHGMALGQLAHGMERLIYIAELHGKSLHRLSEVQAAQAAQLGRVEGCLARIEARPVPTCPKAAPAEAMSWKDKAQLAVLAAAGTAWLLGKLPLRDAVAIAGKPFGF